MPAPDDIRSNMVRGGAEATDLTRARKGNLRTLGPELKRRGLVLVGIDVIDGYLHRINVTSPTGIRAIKRLGGPDLAVAAWDAIEAARSARLSRACAPAFDEKRTGDEKEADSLRIASPRNSLEPDRNI